MSSNSEETLKERAENLQKQISGLASSVESLGSSVRSIPLEKDFHFYNNFFPFRQPVANLKAHSESLLREIGASMSLGKRPPPFPADDPHEAYEWVENIQDDIFERVDVSMDEFRRSRKQGQCGQPGSLEDLESGFQLVYGNRKKGGKSRREAPGSRTPVSKSESSSAVKVASRDKKTAGGRSRVPFHLPNITRPQDRFHIVVDNSKTPFKHRGLQKTEDGSKYIHPLEEELNKLEFVDNQAEVTEPLQPCQWESTPFKFVETVQDLKEMASKLRSANEIAVDLEHNHYRSFQGLTCLMQISTRLEDFVVDTLILHNHIGPCLRGIFSNPGIKKVMHGADRDILWLQRDFGIYVCNLFDTGQASRVLQLERNSLEFLLQHYCGITADKEYQTADWRLRPLPSEMINYARTDTHYLLYVHDVMRQNLASTQSESGDAPLLEVYKRSRDICLQLYEKEQRTETSYLHIYSLQERNFTPEQLAVVAGLYEWRDEIARVEDESTGYILPNKVLLQIAEKMPDNLDELRSFVKGRNPFVERNLATVLDVIKRSRETRSKIVDIAPKPPLQAIMNGTDELQETSQIDNQHTLLSADITTAVKAVLNPQTNDENAFCENSVEKEVTEDKKSNFKETNGRDTNFIEEITSAYGRQTECVKSSSAEASMFITETVPFKLSGLASAVVGRATTSLLFNKNRDSFKGSQAISSDTKGNLVCESVPKQSLPLPSQENVSSETPKVSNIVKENDNDIKKPNLLELTKLAKSSNSGDFILNENSTADHRSFQSNFATQEEAVVSGNIGSSEKKLPSVQAQKRPGRGLAAMLGSSKLKQKNEMSVKMHDPEQDNARNKVEQINASITLPFQPFFRASERTPTELSPKSKENLTNEDSRVEDEVGGVVSTEAAQPEVKIESARPVLKKLGGIVHNGEGKKHRVWWPSVQDNGVQKASTTSKANDRELPPSLSELRRKQHYKHQSSHQFRQSAQQEPHSNVDDFFNGRKRKNHSPEPCNASKDSTISPSSESQFKPFDYAAARLSMHFESTPSRGVKGGNAKKNLSDKKGKGSIFDPMNRVARESSADDIQPGKRRQVFPASGNRTATFR